MSQEISYYTALAMQLTCKAVNKYKSRDEVYQAMTDTVSKIGFEIFAAKKFIGPHLSLVVVPEYFLTSFPFGETITEWKEKACLKKDDPIFEKIGEICIKNKIYFSGNYYEYDENFPKLFFQSSFIINDEGKMILNYRRLNSMYSPTPHDVMDEYVKTYGYEALFPVVETPLGNLACIASEEILYPEVARCLMMRGAEVFLHSSSEIGSPIATKKNIAKQARAIENIAYVVSANSAGIADIGILENSTDGGSQIVHYEGHKLAESSVGESIVANSTIDIKALRHYRSTVSMKNYNARQRFDLYAKSYADHMHYPSNSFLSEEPTRDTFLRLQREFIARYYPDK